MPESPKGKKRPRDVSQLGKAIVDIATGEVKDEEAEGDTPLSPAERGRLGGKRGGPARAKKLTSEERSKSASKAANARWNR